MIEPALPREKSADADHEEIEGLGEQRRPGGGRSRRFLDRTDAFDHRARKRGLRVRQSKRCCRGPRRDTSEDEIRDGGGADTQVLLGRPCGCQACKDPASQDEGIRPEERAGTGERRNPPARGQSVMHRSRRRGHDNTPVRRRCGLGSSFRQHVIHGQIDEIFPTVHVPVEARRVHAELRCNFSHRQRGRAIPIEQVDGCAHDPIKAECRSRPTRAWSTEKNASTGPLRAAVIRNLHPLSIGGLTPQSYAVGHLSYAVGVTVVTGSMARLFIRPCAMA
jgi:hypothetical protein